MTTGMVQDQNLEKQIEKQMGCMAGFLHIFDRHQILAGKRLYSAKRLPPSVGNSTPPPENAVSLPGSSDELEKVQQTRTTPSPDRVKHFTPTTELRSPAPEPATPVETKPKQPLPLPVFEYKEGNRSLWKFSREAPRLSLDSRAIVDGKGSIYPREIRTNASILSANRSETSTEEGDEQRRSPSVIARLMGLEPLPNSEPESIKKAELRRSASESRVSKDFYQNRFIDGNNFRLKQSQHSSSQDNNGSSVLIKNAANMDHSSNAKVLDRNDFAARSTKAEPVRSHRGLGPRKIFFDSADIFPEPKQPASIYGEIEKRLKMRGFPSKDLETERQFLEALQLKGLLRSKKPPSQRNLVYDRISSQAESPIVVMRPARSPTSVNRLGRISNDSPPSSYRSRQVGRRNVNVTGETMPSVTLRHDRLEFDRNLRNQPRNRFSSSPTRCESNVKSPSRRGLFVETQRRVNDPVDQRRASPVQSSKMNSSKFGSDPQISNRSPRNRKPTGSVHHPKERKIYVSQAEDESSTFSESSISNSSLTDTERSNKIEDYREGRSLLERCDKLLHSIAEITATELQPSPVSVLDSSFYKEESSPSPVLKRQIDFKDQVVDVEEDAWFQAISSVESGLADGSDDCDLVYVMDVLRASRCLQDDNSDIFLLLEEQQYLKGKDISKVSRLQRRLIFDTIHEILDRNKQLPPWKSNAQPESIAEPTEIWSEFQRMRDRGDEASEDLFEVICSVLKKDLTRDAPTGWRDWPVETSQAVLDIERLIFKDLIGETIRDLAAFTGKCNLSNAINNMPRRKLVF